jgi:hypothetical protein
LATKSAKSTRSNQSQTIIMKISVLETRQMFSKGNRGWSRGTTYKAHLQILLQEQGKALSLLFTICLFRHQIAQREMEAVMHRMQPETKDEGHAKKIT